MVMCVLQQKRRATPCAAWYHSSPSRRLVKPRIRRSGRTPAVPYPPLRLKALLWYHTFRPLSMYNSAVGGVQFPPVNSQSKCNSAISRCMYFENLRSVSTDGTVQSDATRVFNFERPGCSTWALYSAFARGTDWPPRRDWIESSPRLGREKEPCVEINWYWWRSWEPDPPPQFCNCRTAEAIWDSDPWAKYVPERASGVRVCSSRNCCRRTKGGEGRPAGKWFLRVFLTLICYTVALDSNSSNPGYISVRLTWVPLLSLLRTFTDIVLFFAHISTNFSITSCVTKRCDICLIWSSALCCSEPM